jgi:hypothetical protein
VALLTTPAATWRESPLLASALAVGILFPQLLSVVDVSLTALGWPASATTTYILPLFTRLLCFYHAPPGP